VRLGFRAAYKGWYAMEKCSSAKGGQLLLDFCWQSSSADATSVVAKRQNVVAFVDAKTREVRKGASVASPLKRSL
jgi:hypothetical protein